MFREVKKAKHECRSRQVTAVFKPSEYNSAIKIANVMECSTNSILNFALKEYIERNQDKIAEYDRREGEHEEEN